MTEEFILPVVVAELTGLTIGGLAHLRYLGRGPRFYKPTPKKVLYKRSEVIAWVEASAQTQTGERALVAR
ncbi:AlpA family transcriptional regulator [Cryobacterium sp. Y29]|uniref:helix-turn-helix transcriptional regulator n=1 Tax=Cryobacterium sp. Y29 TaxID=2048285 RepID=UPI000CE30CFC|nr:hypothetical protein [Cryobacterium sp. Y29]